MSSEAGAQTRPAMTDRYWQRGAFEQVSGFNDAMYSMTGSSEALPRVAAGMKVGGGLAGRWRSCSAATRSDGDGSTLASRNRRRSYGRWGHRRCRHARHGSLQRSQPGRDTPDMGRRSQNASNRGTTTTPTTTPSVSYRAKADGTARTGRSRYDPVRYRGSRSEERHHEVMSSQHDRTAARDVRVLRRNPRSQANPPDGRHMQTITGEDVTTTAPVLRKLGRAMGGLAGQGRSRQAAGEHVAKQRLHCRRARSRNVQLRRSQRLQRRLRRVHQLHQQIPKYVSGRACPRKYRTANNIARYGGMLSGYYSTPSDANKFVAANNIQTQPTAQAIQSYLSVAGQFGQTPDEVLGYKSTGGRGMEAITYADQVRSLIDRVGNYRAQLGAGLAQKLGSFGVEMPEATVAVEQYGIMNDAQAGAAASYLGMAQSHGQNTPEVARQMMQYSQAQTPFQTNIMGGVAQNLMGAGASFSTAMSAVSGLGLSDHQATLLGGMAGGDLNAWSQMGRETGNLAYQFNGMDQKSLMMSNSSDWMGHISGSARLWAIRACSERPASSKTTS